MNIWDAWICRIWISWTSVFYSLEILCPLLKIRLKINWFWIFLPIKTAISNQLLIIQKCYHQNQLFQWTKTQFPEPPPLLLRQNLSPFKWIHGNSRTKLPVSTPNSLKSVLSSPFLPSWWYPPLLRCCLWNIIHL